jgi:periplasmic divalent cation tolerance protein
MKIIYTLTDSPTIAQTMAKGVIEKDLAVCVNILPQIESWYKWEGEIQNAQEIALIIKTHEDKTQECITFVESIHNYDTPLILTFEPDSINEPYLKWMTP